MKHFMFVLLVLSMLAAAPVQGQSTTSNGGSTVDFYGFIRTDFIIDSQRPNSAQSPQWIVDGTEDNFTLHPRLTRFGMNYNGGEVGDLGTISGKLEIDFQNGGSDSRARPRYRHAYMTLDMGDAQLLIGQTWDLVSPLYPAANSDTLMWNTGNLGDRRTQIRYSRSLSDGLDFAVAAGLTGAVDQKDLDSNNIKDNQNSNDSKGSKNSKNSKDGKGSKKRCRPYEPAEDRGPCQRSANCTRGFKHHGWGGHCAIAKASVSRNAAPAKGRGTAARGLGAGGDSDGEKAQRVNMVNLYARRSRPRPAAIFVCLRRIESTLRRTGIRFLRWLPRL